jgi:predicted metal-dependent enzyme (double-stranded beta helix superfamily)
MSEDKYEIPDPQGTQKMAMHMDGRGYAISVYNIVVNGGPSATRIVKSTWGKR